MTDEAVTEVIVAAIVVGSEGEALLLVHLEDTLQLVGGGLVEDEAVNFIVIEETAGIEVRTSNGTQTVVNHHHLGMMEARLVV